jgi:hypothetical protein
MQTRARIPQPNKRMSKSLSNPRSIDEWQLS